MLLLCFPFDFFTEPKMHLFKDEATVAQVRNAPTFTHCQWGKRCSTFHERHLTSFDLNRAFDLRRATPSRGDLLHCVFRSRGRCHIPLLGQCIINRLFHLGYCILHESVSSRNHRLHPVFALLLCLRRQNVLSLSRSREHQLEGEPFQAFNTASFEHNEADWRSSSGWLF